MAFVWIYRGRWPTQQRIQQLTEDDAERAVAEGWGQRIEGLDGRECKEVDNTPHEAADHFYRTRMTGGKPSPSVEQPPTGLSESMPPVGGLYGTRHMVAATPSRVPAPPPADLTAPKKKKGS